MLDDARRRRGGLFVGIARLLGLAAVPGLLQAGRHVMAMARHGLPIWTATANAHWAGAQVRALTGASAFRPSYCQLLVDSGLDIDRRFAARPFIYRTV